MTGNWSWIHSYMFVAALFRHGGIIISTLWTVYCSVPVAGINTYTASKDPQRV